MSKRFLIDAVLAVGLSGCAGLNSTEQRVLTGGGIGAGAGAAAGALAGGQGVGAGALIGAGVGAAIGFIVDQADRPDQIASAPVHKAPSATTGAVWQNGSAPDSIAATSPQPGPLTTVRPNPSLPVDPSRIDFGQYHALVIGDNSYASLPRLLTAVADAAAVATMLREEYGFDVTLLSDATRNDIIGALSNLRLQLAWNDNLLIYYAGHGWYDQDAERGYWLPVDAERENQSNWISNADITDTLKALKAKHVMVVADSCYSGTLTRDANLTVRALDYLQRVVQKKARTVLTSGGLEPVVDSGGGGHSVFAKALLDALRSNAGALDGQALFTQLRQQVVLNAQQTPEYSNIRLAGHDGGDFVFVKR